MLKPFHLKKEITWACPKRIPQNNAEPLPMKETQAWARAKREIFFLCLVNVEALPPQERNHLAMPEAHSPK
jgi:hypothetical protein